MAEEAAAQPSWLVCASALQPLPFPARRAREQPSQRGCGLGSETGRLAHRPSVAKPESERGGWIFPALPLGAMAVAAPE